MTQTTLHDYLAALDVPEEVSRAWLMDEVLVPLGVNPDSELAEVCEDAFVAALSGNDDMLHMRPGGWRMDIAGSVVRAALAAGLLGAGLFLGGADDVPVELLPAVVPLLVNLEKVRLDRREREFLAPLRVASAGIEGMAVSPQVLFNRLDPLVREQLAYDDFLRLCERLIEAGEMDDAGYDDVRARPAGQSAWIRITWT